MVLKSFHYKDTSGEPFLQKRIHLLKKHELQSNQYHILHQEQVLYNLHLTRRYNTKDLSLYVYAVFNLLLYRLVLSYKLQILNKVHEHRRILMLATFYQLINIYYHMLGQKIIQQNNQFYNFNYDDMDLTGSHLRIYMDHNDACKALSQMALMAQVVQVFMEPLFLNTPYYNQVLGQTYNLNHQLFHYYLPIDKSHLF